MHDATFRVPTPSNEPILSYAPGSAERAALEGQLNRMAGEEIEIPCIIGGKRVKTERQDKVVMPCDKGHVLATFHVAGPKEMNMAIDAALAAKAEWENTPWEARAAVFLRAAELLAGKYRQVLNGSTMLGMSKTCFQAEIDSACEFIDFLRFNASYAQELYAQQPISAPGIWNALELRPLEGFVFALTPFNFSAIAGNLSCAPALMGNTIVWKPSESQTLAAYYTQLLYEEAGLPPGVINFVPGYGQELAPVAMGHEQFAGLHFTGSTHVFKELWRTAANNLDIYKSYPRIVGETGGKDFLVAHPSADDRSLITAIVRGAYEFQGQKCSALSRLYLPESTWGRIKDELCETINGLAMGDVRDFTNFLGAVIKKQAFDKHEQFIEEAKGSNDYELLAGGECDDSKGFFVRPTLFRSSSPASRGMSEEFFGPILNAYVYKDDQWPQILETVDQTSPYGLTGAVFANERTAILEAKQALRHSAGNFYVNDKPTGAVVGQQPFGGSRASGTNDKAGAAQNLQRWVSARTIKETFTPPTSHRYPHMG